MCFTPNCRPSLTFAIREHRSFQYLKLFLKFLCSLCLSMHQQPTKFFTFRKPCRFDPNASLKISPCIPSKKSHVFGIFLIVESKSAFLTFSSQRIQKGKKSWQQYSCQLFSIMFPSRKCCARKAIPFRAFHPSPSGPVSKTCFLLLRHLFSASHLILKLLFGAIKKAYGKII